MKKIAPGFSHKLIGAAAGLAEALIPKSQAFQDTSAVQFQLQEREQAARRQEASAQRALRSAESAQVQERDATRQRVEALDRIIGVFQQNLRIR